MKNMTNTEVAIWCFTGVYMALAFIAGDANPTNWEDSGRTVFIFLSGITTAIALFIKHIP